MSAVWLLASCLAFAPPPPVPESAARSIPLLNFDRQSDLVFVDHHAGLEPQAKGSALRLEGETTNFKLRAALGPRILPGEWQLLSLRVHSTQTGKATLSLYDGETPLGQTQRDIASGEWQSLSIDLSELPEQPERANLRVVLTTTDGGSWMCDDLQLTHNRFEAFASNDWTITQRGTRWAVSSRDRFEFSLGNALSAEGFSLTEANAVRAIFSSAAHTVVVYADGRCLRDGEAQSLVKSERLPKPLGDIAVHGETARLDRDTPGDSDDDGFNESRGVWTLQAAGRGLEATITPQSTPIAMPTFEISGLPAGEAVVSVDGRYIATSVRLSNGILLVCVPLEITRATQLSVHVR